MPSENYTFEPFNTALCPSIEDYVTKVGEKSVEIFRLLIEFLKEISPEWDYTSSFPKLERISDIFKISDFLISKKFVGQSLISEPRLEKLEILTTMTYFLYFSNLELADFFTSELNKVMLSFLQKAKEQIINDKESYKNLVLIVGHKLNLLFLFQQLGLSSYECLQRKLEGEKIDVCETLPVFGSSISFEIYSENDRNFVDFVFNGKKKRFCGIEDSEKCSLDDTIIRLKSLVQIPNQEVYLTKFCLPPPENANDKLKGMIGFNVAVLAFLSAILIRKRLKEKKQE